MLLFALAALVGCPGIPGPGDVPAPLEWPTREWPRSTPEAQGLDSAGLAKVLDVARRDDLALHGVALVRNGRLVLDACFFPADCTRPHDLASVTKSVVSTLVGMAVDRGALGLDAPMLSFFPERAIARADPRKNRITVRDLVGMSAGFDCGLSPGEPEVLAMAESDDWVQFALDLPMVEEPGRSFAYCSPNYHLLSAILGRALGEPIDSFARRELFDPLGIGAVIWPRDGHGIPIGGGDLRMRPLDMARIGLLYLQGGRWQERRIVSEPWIRSATRARLRASADGTSYGLGWWIPEGRLPGLFEARGRAGQGIVVWPAANLVVAATAGGASLTPLVGPFLEALRSDGAIEENPIAAQSLREKLEAARLPPPARPVPRAPEWTSRVEGRRYEVGANPAGIEALEVTFRDSGPEGRIDLFRKGHRFPLVFGLDGVWRINAEGPTGTPVGLRGKILPDGELLLQYSEPAGVNHFSLSLRFLDDRVILEIDDPTDLLDAEFEGRAADAVAR